MVYLDRISHFNLLFFYRQLSVSKSTGFSDVQLDFDKKSFQRVMDVNVIMLENCLIFVDGSINGVCAIALSMMYYWCKRFLTAYISCVQVL